MKFLGLPLAIILERAIITTITLFTPNNAKDLLESQDRLVLELFGGKTGKVEGAINVDRIAEKGIRADVIVDKLSFITDSIT